jgi:hypothetical protein
MDPSLINSLLTIAAVASPAAPLVTFIVSEVPVSAPDSDSGGRHGIGMDGSFSS